MKSKLLPIIAIILLCCQSEYAKHLQTEDSVETQIVLFNIENFSRKEIANYINEINKCSPSVIGLNVNFRELSNFKDDSLLAAAISNSGKVILSILLPDVNNPEGSASLFTQAARGQGIISLTADENDVITGYYPIYENDNGQEMSFPTMVADYASPDATAGMIFKTTQINTSRDIVYTKTLENFERINKDDIDCGMIEGKIVLFGFLGPGNENAEVTPLDKVEDKGTRTYVTVILANIILNILDELKEIKR